MARPPKDDPRTHWLKYRANDAEHSEIRLKATQAGLSFSEFQRQAALNAVVVGRRPIADTQLILSISGIANNANQTTRSLNTLAMRVEELGETDLAQEIRDTLEQVVPTWDYVRQLLGTLTRGS